MLFTWWKEQAISLLGKQAWGLGRAGGPTGLCAGLHFWTLRTRDPLRMDAGTSSLGRGSVTPRPGLRSEAARAFEGFCSDGDSFKPQRAGRAGGVLAVAVAGCVLWAQLLSLVSEEALPNKMSLSWDMLLSCDLVLMRNWVLRNITLSCSCLSSR